MIYTVCIPKDLLLLSRPVGMRRSISTYALASVKDTSRHVRWTETPNSTSSASVHCSVTATKTQQCDRSALSKTTQMRKEEEAAGWMSEEVLRPPSPQPCRAASLSGDDGAAGEREEAGSRAEEDLHALHSETFHFPGEREREKGEADSFVKPNLTGAGKQGSYCQETSSQSGNGPATC